ncbi:receptor-like protein kinase [Gossypium australe]|uniref:Receptor-like protein kinase n=1 Tax=Gossypium australe TaxID=47621 RepID=A0A5B6V9P8_9ROSI|nr:receptor-like protein kinase [Gossypium australe]
MFKHKGKLSLRFIGHYEVVERISPLPHELDRIHDVFHVSMLRKYRTDLSHVVPVDDIEEEKPMKIMAREVKVLRNKIIPLVKVWWQNHKTSEAT